MRCMSQNFRLFLVSNSSVQNFRIFQLVYPGSVKRDRCGGPGGRGSVLGRSPSHVVGQMAGRGAYRGNDRYPERLWRLSAARE